MNTNDTTLIPMADDDEDDCTIAEDALRESGARCGFGCVQDGIELMG